ncbi:MAG: adenosine deaminase [Acidiferrobacterales bacterium]|nr:adenosine deaminase [Acidiferrobacterales bacterium]
MNSLKTFIEGLPKAELHLHLEGSIEPEQMFEFAHRNKVKIPFSSVEEVRAAYDFSNLQDFLDIYYTGMQVLQTEKDFYQLTEAYLRRVASENVQHVEVFFDPQGHTDRGIAFETVIGGIKAALDQVGSQLGVSHKLIMCFLRHLSEEQAFETLEQAKPFMSLLDGVGLDSSELGHPPQKFQRVFRAAKDCGLKLVAHAGEEGPPEYVEQALDLLNIDRLDHGNRSLESEYLVTRLAREQIALTVCPLSNLKLCVVQSLERHPLREMMNRGLLITINSDDPSYFGGYVNDNYLAIAQALNLSQAELVQLAKNSFTGSFLNPEEIKRYHQDIDTYFSENATF